MIGVLQGRESPESNQFANVTAPNREYDCHTKCETYIKYRHECDEEMKKRVLERVVMNEICDTSERIRKKRRPRR